MRKKYIPFILCLAVLFSLVITCTEAKRDGEDGQSAEIRLDTLQGKDVQNLGLLCKVWGFLKYYHPAVASGKYDWDNELIKILPEILNCPTNKSRDKILNDWIESLGEVKQGKPMVVDTNTVKMLPDLDWTKDEKELDKDLILNLEKIINANREEKNHYVKLTPHVGNPIFTNENAYSSETYPNVEHRLIALFRYWNMIQYYYPYRYLLKDSWESALTEFIPKFVEAKNAFEYKRTLKKLIVSINDSHAEIYDSEIESLKGNFIIPVELAYVEKEVVVVDHYRTDKIKNYPLQKGDIIKIINNESVDEIISREYDYTSGSNHSKKLNNLLFNLLRSHSNSSTVSYERESITQTDTLKAYPLNTIGRGRNIFQKDKPFFEYLASSDIVYLYLGSTRGGSIPKTLNNKGLIIDLRCYPSDKIEGYFDIPYLYSTPTEFAKFTFGNVRYPGLFLFSRPIFTQSSQTVYPGLVVILVNELSQSHAEFMAMKYRSAENAVLIGSQTSGADGNVSEIILPGNIKTFITGIGIYHPNGRETQGVGIIPDIEVKPTIKGISESRDEVLEKAIELIQQ